LRQLTILSTKYEYRKKLLLKNLRKQSGL